MILLVLSAVCCLGDGTKLKEVKRIELETEYDIDVVLPEHAAVGFGRIVVGSRYWAQIFDSESGRFIARIGGRGQGPGEFDGVFNIMINPHYIIVYDNSTEVFDLDGNWLYRINDRFKFAIWEQGRFFGQVLSASKADELRAGKKPLMMGGFEFSEKGFSEVTQPFGELSQSVMDYEFWFQNHYCAAVGSEIAVANEVDSKITLFRSDSLSKVKEISINLPRYVNGPGHIDHSGGTTADEFLWVYTFSRIFALEQYKSDLAVGYFIPNPGRHTNPAVDDVRDLGIAVIDLEGGGVKDWTVIHDDLTSLIGGSASGLYLLKVVEGDDRNRASVSLVEW